MNSMSKDFLIEKIASSVGVEIKDSRREDVLLKTASQMLKIAALKQRDLESKLKIAEEANQELLKAKADNEKSVQAKNIANDMFEKGLIRRSDVDSKIDELMSSSSDELAIIKKTIDAITSTEKSASEDYTSDLTFLVGNNNIKTEEKETLSKALEKMF